MEKRKKERSHAFLRAKNRKSGILGSMLFAYLLCLAVSFGILLLCALVLSYFPKNITYIGILGSGLGAFFALLGGILAGKRQTEDVAALSGLGFGVLYLITLAVTAHILGAATPFLKRLVGYTVFLLLSVLGGVLGGMRPKRSTRRHR